MDKFKNPRTLKMMDVVLASFIWMVLALAWNNFIDSIISILRKKFIFLWLLWYLTYIIITAFVSILVIIAYTNFTEQLEDVKDENQKSEDN